MTNKSTAVNQTMCATSQSEKELLDKPKAYSLAQGKRLDIDSPSRLKCVKGEIQIFVATDKDYSTDENRYYGCLGVFLRYSSNGQADELPAHSRVMALSDASVTIEPIDDAERLTERAERMYAAQTMDVEGRVRFELEKISNLYRHNNCPEGVQVKMFRQTMADIVGCSREMVGRIASRLNEQGVISWEKSKLTIYREKPMAVRHG